MVGPWPPRLGSQRATLSTDPRPLDWEEGGWSWCPTLGGGWTLTDASFGTMGKGQSGDCSSSPRLPEEV